MDKYIGRLLDNRYEILEVIGTGGMAVVYKARCHRLNRLVAIKILKDDYLEDEEFRRRFHSESQAVAMLSHPNIVSIYDVSTSITADYIVMELIDGITLKQYMEKKGVLNWKETLHFAIQIAKALEHAHSKGIVHRDINPHNVMVLKNGSVKVTDFGIARMMSKGNTLTKEALGSVHYISPEQAKGGRVDSRSDIYSLGVVMYEMMSGRPPYDGESPVAVAIQHINGGAAMPSTLNPNIPGGLEQIIMRAMAHEPSERYTSATQMLGDMDEFRKDPGILFDYNTPPLDEVIKLNKPPLVLDVDTPPSTAEKVERRRAEQSEMPRRRSTSASGRSASGSNRSRQPARRNTEAEEQKRSNVATISIIACSAVMVIAIVIFLVVLFSDGAGSKPQLVEVPELIGKVYEELPAYGDFKIKIDKEVYDEEYPAGQIIEQTPAAGEQIEKNKTVYVTVSLGETPKIVKMPDIVNWELSQAERALNNLGLNLQLKPRQENHDDVPEGSVIRTEPAADEDLATGQEVTLYVSLGMEMKVGTMPDVVGDKLDSAKKILGSQELNLEIVEEQLYDSEVAAGDVIRTEPAAGEELTTGQTVTLYVSQGAQLATMPNVVGMSISNAYSVLNTEGFVTPNIVYVDSKAVKDEVVSQSVEKNTKVDVNTQITLEVSKGSVPLVTKEVKVKVPTGMENASIAVISPNGAPAQFVVSGQSSAEVTLRITGSGKGTYTVNFTDYDADEQASVDVEVDFDK